MSDIQQTIKAAWDRKQAYAAIKEKFQESLVFSHSGGMWRADRETIAFLSAFLHSSPEQITMEDVYGVPRQINPKELLDLCINKYQYVANIWSVEYRELSRIRRAENV
jgi:hypothetical protein